MNEIDKGGFLLFLSGCLFSLAIILLFYTREQAEFSSLKLVIIYASISILFEVFALVGWIAGWNRIRNVCGGKK